MLRQMTGPIRQQGVQEALKELAGDGHNIARLEAPARRSRLNDEEEAED